MDTSPAKPNSPTIPSLAALCLAASQGEVALPLGGIKLGGHLHYLLHFVLEIIPSVPAGPIKEVARRHNNGSGVYEYLRSSHSTTLDPGTQATNVLQCLMWALRKGHDGDPKWRATSGEGFLVWAAVAAELADKGEIPEEKYHELTAYLLPLGFNPHPPHPLDSQLLRFSLL